MNALLVLAFSLSLTAPSGALDWNVRDPGAGWKAALPQAPAAVAAVDRSFGAERTANVIDNYVLALAWTPEFCAFKNPIECSRLTQKDWAAKNMALHGLWPNKRNDPQHGFGYCGVEPAVQRLDKRDTWCQMPATGISSQGLETLSTFMPGTGSCLQNHEWYKHGTCSGMEADDYFALAASMTAKFAATAPGRFITANVGRKVSAEDLLAAFDAEFGAGARRSVILNCGQTSGALGEIQLTLAGSVRTADDLAKLAPASRGGSCSASFLIPALH